MTNNKYLIPFLQTISNRKKKLLSYFSSSYYPFYLHSSKTIYLKKKHLMLLMIIPQNKLKIKDRFSYKSPYISSF